MSAGAMLAGAAAAILLAMAMMLARALLGPTPYDRMLAVNSFGTKTILLVGVAGFLAGRPAFLDIAIAYALVNFTATVALLKATRYRSLQAALSRRGARQAPSPGDADV
jgi:multicomponent Na+:H+ antiporter subunit F